MTENTVIAPLCSACGSAMVRKWGAAGPFMGCTSYPLCRHTVDLSGTPNEHPLMRTRRLALRWLQKRPQWSEDDRADAVGDALVVAMRGGWAERAEAWRFVAKQAYRALRGWQMRNGKRYSARSRAGAKSIASRAMSVQYGRRDDDAGLVDPDIWLDHQSGPRPDPEAVLDLIAHFNRGDGTETLQGILALLAELGLTRAEVAHETGYSRRTLTMWAAGEVPGFHPGRAEKARAALLDLLARARRGDVRPAAKPPTPRSRPAPAPVTRRDGEAEGCWLVRQAVASGRTQVEVAACVGVTQAAISRWAASRTTPGAEHLQTLRALHATLTGENRP